MNKLKVVFKRSRPLLGTFVEVTLFAEETSDKIDSELCHDLMTRAFEKALQLEKVFNIHDAKSDLNIFNESADPETCKLHSALKEVLEKAQEFSILSEGAFDPHKKNSSHWDLSGIAKGYIVDQMVEFFVQENPQLQGLVNAGGDLRFFNCPSKQADIRMGSSLVIRSLPLFQDALATSAPQIAMTDERSSTVYRKPFREGLSAEHTVSVVADSCMIADALTKVGLFAKKEVVQKCASFFKAQLLIFDAEGELVEVFENYENQ